VEIRVVLLSTHLQKPGNMLQEEKEIDQRKLGGNKGKITENRS